MVQEEKGMTPFGMIKSDYLIFNIRQGRLSRVSPEAIPLRHISSVTLEVRRHPVFGVLLALVTIACAEIASPVGIAIAVVPLTLTVLLLWGSPSVKVNTTDGNIRRANGLPWTLPEAEWFVTVVDRHRQSDVSSPC